MVDAVKLFSKLKKSYSSSPASPAGEKAASPGGGSGAATAHPISSPDSPAMKLLCSSLESFPTLQGLPLHSFLLPGLPTVLYADGVLPEGLAKELVTAIDADPSPWVELKKRRLRNIGGTVTSAGLTEQHPLPPYLRSLARALVTAGLFPEELEPNHVLLNDYPAGQGIMPHTDGPAYFPRVCTISLLSSCLLHFRSSLSAPPAMEVLLRPNSLVCFTGEAYETFLHGIASVWEERTAGRTGDAGKAEVAEKQEEGKEGDGRDTSSSRNSCPCVNAESGLLIERDRRISITLRYVPLPGESREKWPALLAELTRRERKKGGEEGGQKEGGAAAGSSSPSYAAAAASSD